MDYLCAYDWQQAEDCVCLVLKQLEFPGEVSVVFGCMSYNRTFVRLVMDWFYEKALIMCQRSNGEAEVMEKMLRQELENLGNKIGGTVFWGVGDNFVLGRIAHRKEEKKIRVGLLNERFGRPHYKELLAPKQEEEQNRIEQERTEMDRMKLEEEIMIVSGRLESEVGILMATEDFFLNLSMEQIQACLNVKVLNEERKLQKRLGELAQEVERKGGMHPAGMLIVTCQKK